MSLGLNKDSSFLWPCCAQVHEPKEGSNSSNIINDTFPKGNCLNIWALPNFPFFFGCVVLALFIHPCPEASASSSAALTCSQQLWFLNTKEWKKLNEKHNLFISGMSQLPEQPFWARSMFFSPQSVQRILFQNIRVYRFWHVYFHGKDMLGFQRNQQILVLLFICRLENSQ